MIKALIYCRVSTEEQANEGYSLEAQEHYCRQFAQHNGCLIVGVYRDEGKSGTSMERPALQELISRVQQERSIGAVIVQETDRLARNTQDHLAIRTLLHRSGVRLISVAQPMLDDSPEGKMVDTIIASVNQFQSDINSRKTKKGLQEKFDAGWWPGWAPLGYLNKALGDQRKVVVPDPQAWPLVKEAFRMYLSGQYSAMEIADTLFERGLRSRMGQKVCNSIMTSLLRNPFYAGVMRWHGQEHKGKHKPMITLEEHRRILEILEGHNLHACRRRRHRFLLTGFLFCGLCGARYTAEVHPLKHIAYYHCAFQGRRGKERPHTNRGQNVEVYALERQVERRIRSIQFSPDFVERVVTKVRALHEEQRAGQEERRRKLWNQKLALERKRAIAEDKLLEGTLSSEDFRRVRERLDGELATIQGQLDEVEGQRAYDMQVIEGVLNLARDIHRAYQAAPYELKRQYLALFWERFVAKDRGIVRAVPTPLIGALLKERRVIIRGNWLPSPKLIITMKNHEYLAHIRQNLLSLVSGGKGPIRVMTEPP